MKSKSDGARVTAGVRLAAVTGVHIGQVGAQTRVVGGRERRGGELTHEMFWMKKPQDLLWD